MLVKIIKEVPNDIFIPLAFEVSRINWENVEDNTRKNNGSNVFEYSKAIHLRSSITEKSGPKNIKDWTSILECKNNEIVIQKFRRTFSAANWIFKEVGGLNLGKIMIVRVEGNSGVGLHIDPNEYFENYSRFHIPIKTNLKVNFFGEDPAIKEHMPIKTLCQLNNRLPHQLENKSDDFRVHLIVDVEVEGKNEIF